MCLRGCFYLPAACPYLLPRWLLFAHHAALHTERCQTGGQTRGQSGSVVVGPGSASPWRVEAIIASFSSRCVVQVLPSPCLIRGHPHARNSSLLTFVGVHRARHRHSRSLRASRLHYDTLSCAPSGLHHDHRLSIGYRPLCCCLCHGWCGARLCQRRRHRHSRSLRANGLHYDILSCAPSGLHHDRRLAIGHRPLRCCLCHGWGGARLCQRRP